MRVGVFLLPLAFVACNAILGNEPITIVLRPSESDGGTVDDAGDVDAEVEEDSGVPGVGCNGKPDCERVAFVTTKTEFGNTGTVAFEKACAETAASSTHPRVKGRAFVPWISTTTLPARTRLVNGTGRYISPFGAVIAQNFADLTKGTLTSAIYLDQNGQQSLVVGDTKVWTGTLPDGAVSENCADWTGTGLGVGEIGLSGEVDGTWSAEPSMRLGCTVKAHVYCIEK